jgi:hypothetical protein
MKAKTILASDFSPYRVAEAVLGRVDENTVHELNEFRVDANTVHGPSEFRTSAALRQLPMDHLPEGSM